jgi:hypothetical protein
MPTISQGTAGPRFAATAGGALRRGCRSATHRAFPLSEQRSGCEEGRGGRHEEDDAVKGKTTCIFKGEGGWLTMWRDMQCYRLKHRALARRIGRTEQYALRGRQLPPKQKRRELPTWAVEAPEGRGERCGQVMGKTARLRCHEQGMIWSTGEGAGTVAGDKNCAIQSAQKVQGGGARSVT